MVACAVVEPGLGRSTNMVSLADWAASCYAVFDLAGVDHPSGLPGPSESVKPATPKPQWPMARLYDLGKSPNRPGGDQAARCVRWTRWRSSIAGCRCLPSQ